MLNHLTIFYEVSTPFPPFGVKTGDNMRNTFVMNKNRIPVNRMKFKACQDNREIRVPIRDCKPLEI